MLNIHIGKIMLDAHTPEPPYSFTGLVVSVRDRYRTLDADEGDGRPVCVPLACGERWNPGAISNFGTPGAYEAAIEPERVATVVADLRAAWPDAPVQDGSGRFEHLATVPWTRAW